MFIIAAQCLFAFGGYQFQHEYTFSNVADSSCLRKHRFFIETVQVMNWIDAIIRLSGLFRSCDKELIHDKLIDKGSIDIDPCNCMVTPRSHRYAGAFTALDAITPPRKINPLYRSKHLINIFTNLTMKSLFRNYNSLSCSEKRINLSIQ